MNEFKEFKTNGIPILYHNNNSDNILIATYFLVGASHEPPGKRGISHYVEHVTFRDKSFIKSKEMLYQLDKNGSYGAETSWDYTKYYVCTHKGNVENALNLLLKVALNFNVSKSEFNKEKEIILRELKEYREDPKNLADILALKKIYGIDVDAEVIGKEDDLKNLDLKDVKEWFEKYYTPKNMYLTFVGNISKSYIQKLVSKQIMDYNKGIKPKVINTKFNPGHFEFIGKKEKKQRIMRITYPAFSFKSENYLHQELFTEMFGGNFSSALYTQLALEKGKVYSPKCSLELTDAFNQMVIDTECSKKDLNFVQDSIFRIFNTFSNQKNLEEILKYAKNQLLLKKIDINPKEELLESEIIFPLIKRKISTQEDIETIKKTTIDDILDVWQGFRNNEPTIIISAKD